MFLSKIKKLFNPKSVETWYEKYEGRISVVALILGFILDNIFLGRVDSLNDMLVITTYVAISGLCIVLIHINESKKHNLYNARMHFWLAFCLQFCLGGIFSAYVVFYVRSATLESSWPFLVLLAAYFLGNEYFKKYYLSLSFSLGVYFFALLSYFILVVPTVLKSISSSVFVLSTVIAVFVFGFFVWIISLYKKEHIKINRNRRIAYYLTMLVLINAFYFLNVIPPLPLILKDVGVYHNLKRQTDGNYMMQSENSNSLFDFFNSKEVFHRMAGEPVYVFSSVYSPVDLNLNVIHNWQKYDSEKGEWVTESNVTVPIKGGRQGGYRLYSFKQYIEDGTWRVNILTEDKRLIGRTNFEVITGDTNTTTTTVLK
ncbi:MAG: DUF2914 domain-containing protein [Patescibacteria group bacterium]